MSIDSKDSKTWAINLVDSLNQHLDELCEFSEFTEIAENSDFVFLESRKDQWDILFRYMPTNVYLCVKILDNEEYIQCTTERDAINFDIFKVIFLRLGSFSNGLKNDAETLPTLLFSIFVNERQKCLTQK